MGPIFNFVIWAQICCGPAHKKNWTRQNPRLRFAGTTDRDISSNDKTAFMVASQRSQSKYHNNNKQSTNSQNSCTKSLNRKHLRSVRFRRRRFRKPRASSQFVILATRRQLHLAYLQAEELLDRRREIRWRLLGVGRRWICFGRNLCNWCSWSSRSSPRIAPFPTSAISACSSSKT